MADKQVTKDSQARAYYVGGFSAFMQPSSSTANGTRREIYHQARECRSHADLLGVCGGEIGKRLSVPGSKKPSSTL